MKRKKALRFVAKWNPAAKQYLRRCLGCGQQGFAPQILEDDFTTTGATHGPVNFERLAIREALSTAYEPMPLDERGLCPTCSEVAGSDSP